MSTTEGMTVEQLAEQVASWSGRLAALQAHVMAIGEDEEIDPADAFLELVDRLGVEESEPPLLLPEAFETFRQGAAKFIFCAVCGSWVGSAEAHSTYHMRLRAGMAAQALMCQLALEGVGLFSAVLDVMLADDEEPEPPKFDPERPGHVAGCTCRPGVIDPRCLALR